MSDAKPGKPLRETGLCDPQQLGRLAALSITTCEELVSLAKNELEFFGTLLHVSDMNDLLIQANNLATEPITQEEEQMFDSITYTYGATSGIKKQAQFHAGVVPPPAFFAMPKQEVNLQKYLGPVRDQRDRSTCVAFAAVAARECVLKKNENKGTDLSEQYLYYLCKKMDGQLNPASLNKPQTSLDTARPLLQQKGVCEEAIWPYVPIPVPNNEGQGPPPPGADVAASAYRINTAPNSSANLIDDIIAQLSQELPVAVSVGVYPCGQADTFSATVVKKYGNIPMPLPGKGPTDEHAVCLIGYKIDPVGDWLGGGYFIVRNSWGQKWGTNSSLGKGYGRIPFHYVEQYCTVAFSLGSVGHSTS